MPCLQKRAARSIPNHRTGQDLLDENVPIHDDVPTHFRSPKVLKHLFLGSGKPIPGQRSQEGLNEGQALDVLRVPHGVMKAQTRAPIMNDQGDVSQFHPFDETFHVSDMIEESVLETGLSDFPIPIKSRELQRALELTWGIMFRQRYDQVGLP